MNDVDLTRTLNELFPATAGSKLPMPRFGKTPAPPAQPLPLVGTAMLPAIGSEQKFGLEWADADLGVHVTIRLEGDELWAFVEGTGAALAGTSASIALVSEKSDRFLSRLVPLAAEADQRWRGRVSFGIPNDIRRQLGNRVTLDVFLMD